MAIPDLVNGAFESIGGMAVLLHCRRAWLDKQVRGASMFATLFFSSWGFWNLYYYPHLTQWASFLGGCVIVLANVLWLGLMWKYRRN